MSDETSLDTRGLDNLLRACKGDLPQAKVGILGPKTARKTGENNNATIGLKHEFGLDGMPIRSFLRVPLMTHLEKFLDNAGAFDSDAMKAVIRERSLMVWMKKIAAVAETVIAEAFASGGFGQWKPSNMKFKKNKQTLVETQQLRNSISSEVK